MGRPPQLSGDLVSISVHGKGAAWCDGEFAGDPDIIASAHQAADIELPVRIGRDYYQATTTDSLGALAALMAYSAQALVVQVPDDIAALLSQDAENPEEAWGDGDVPSED